MLYTSLALMYIYCSHESNTADTNSLLQNTHGYEIFSLYFIKYPPYRKKSEINVSNINLLNIRWYVYIQIIT
jgi:hypothetical protein